MALIQISDKLRIDPAHVTQINIVNREIVLASGQKHTLSPAAMQDLIFYKTKKEGAF